MFGALDAVFRTGLAAFCAAVSEVFVLHHPLAVDHPFWRRAGNPVVGQLLKERGALRLRQPDLAGKLRNKAALRQEMGLDEAKPAAPLFGVVSRLTAQKGLDLVLAALPALLRQGAQLVVQGSGDPVLEAAFSAAAHANPGQVALRVAYDEALAHRVIAGSDVILVPSRFEPCGLTQLYGLRYGTLPVVRRVGGLADTVVDAGEAAVRDGRATGFVFDAATPAALEAALRERGVDEIAWYSNERQLAEALAAEAAEGKRTLSQELRRALKAAQARPTPAAGALPAPEPLRRRVQKERAPRAAKRMVARPAQ